MRRFLDSSTLVQRANAAVGELKLDVSALERACLGTSFFADEAVKDQCETMVVASNRVVLEVAPRLIDRIRQGDASAATSLATLIQKTRVQVQDVLRLTNGSGTTGGLLDRFLDEVVKQTGEDIRENAAPIAFGFGTVLAIGLIGWILLEMTRRR